MYNVRQNFNKFKNKLTSIEIKNDSLILNNLMI